MERIYFAEIIIVHYHTTGSKALRINEFSIRTMSLASDEYEKGAGYVHYKLINGNLP